MNRLSLSLLALLLLAQVAYGQKVKYKDLFILLNARQFDQAEPFLKKYLKDNDDNPNAYLFMGQIYQERSLKADVLKESDLCKKMADSAIFFYDKSYKGLTEKEVTKKNAEYYESYSRRDLRTGEFGIKLSDVQLDVEKRIQSMKDRGARVLLVNTQFKQLQDSYSVTVQAFTAIQAAYAGTKELLLQSDDKTIISLHRLESLYDSTSQLFNTYKATMTLLGKTGYNQTISPVEIKDLKTDLGSSTPDFYAEEIKLRDFKKWASGIVEIIERDVTPLRKVLISYDIEINKLADKVRKDSVSVTSDLRSVELKLQENPVAKFDPAPMPLEVFKMKIAELRYGSLRVENKKARDSADLVVKAKSLQAEHKAIAAVDSLAAKLMERNMDEDAVNYQHFVTNAYGTTTVLKSLVKATHEYAVVEKVKRAEELKKTQASLEWLLVDLDSIPLMVEKAAQRSAKPLLVTDLLTIGLKFQNDSLATGYMYTITPSRKPDVKASFPVDQVSFSIRNLPVTKALSKADANAQLFFALVYSETKVGEKFPVTIAKIYRTDGLAWANNFTLDFPPSELIINAQNGDLSVKITSSTGESKIVIVDKNGKLLP